MNVCNKLVFVAGIPNLIFANEAGVEAGEAPFSCSTLGFDPGLATHIQQTRQEKVARDKH